MTEVAALATWGPQNGWPTCSPREGGEASVGELRREVNAENSGHAAWKLLDLYARDDPQRL